MRDRTTRPADIGADRAGRIPARAGCAMSHESDAVNQPARARPLSAACRHRAHPGVSRISRATGLPGMDRYPNSLGGRVEMAPVGNALPGSEAVLQLQIVSGIGQGARNPVLPAPSAQLVLQQPIGPFVIIFRELLNRVRALHIGRRQVLLAPAL